MKKVRAMWLLNHGTARKYEVPMLKLCGIEEIFLPKIIPNDISFRSASINYDEDKHLSIPAEELKIINDANWYEEPGLDAWNVANKYFDVVFFICYKLEFLHSISRHFQGAMIWRQYGLDKTMTYSLILNAAKSLSPTFCISKIQKRFWCGQGYDHLHQIEENILKSRKIDFPVLYDENINDLWNGCQKKILFICPDVEINPYYKKIYEKFKLDFYDFPYLIGGNQYLQSSDPNVIGFVPKEIHEQNMRELRCMFYHSDEPYHIHYHPFEAIQKGMPLIFMANGILDRFGGKNLPGRCETIHEARKKIQQIFNDNNELIQRIRQSQSILLEPMLYKNCISIWKTNLEHIVQSLNYEKVRNSETVSQYKPNKKIAVILPVEYKGGSLRGAKLLLNALYEGSTQSSQKVDIIFGYIDSDIYTQQDFAELHANIKCRPFTWKIINKKIAQRILIYSNNTHPITEETYQVADDGMNYFLDCDLLVIISDRLEHALLPNTNYILIVYDYLQRYENFMPPGILESCLRAALLAKKVLVTTEFTKRDAIQFAGISESKIEKLPILVPKITRINDHPIFTSQEYFLWITNIGSHKNHTNAFEALQIYYEQLDGKLKCFITGVNSEKIIKNKSKYLKSGIKIFKDHDELYNNLKFFGEVTDTKFYQLLSSAKFLWHPTKVDNGTFSVLEAKIYSTPVLSSDYPAMREMDNQFDLNLNWMDQHNPYDMAKKLKEAEINFNKNNLISNPNNFNELLFQKNSLEYWNIIKNHL